MRSVAVVAAALFLAGSAAAQEPQKPAAPDAAKPAQEPAKAAPEKPASKPTPKAGAKRDDSRTLYGLGLAIARSLEPLALSSGEVEHVVRGIKDAIAKKPKAKLDAEMQSAISELAQTRSAATQKESAAKEREAGAPYLAKMAGDPNAKKTPSGAIVLHEKQGTGESPKETDKVKVNYTGKLVSGAVFDSSAGRGPAEFPLGQVIKCWTEALQTMKVGGKAKVVCPSEIAYGPGGRPPVIPGNAVLTFDIELLEIVK